MNLKALPRAECGIPNMRDFDRIKKRELGRKKSLAEKLILRMVENPALAIREIAGRLREKGEKRSGSIIGKVNGINFEYEIGLGAMVRKMYFGSYELDVLYALKKHLKKGDVFIDVGANIGYVTAYAMGLVGKSGQVHSFEPVSEYFKRLVRVSQMNAEYNLVANNCALGEDNGSGTIYISKVNLGWNTLDGNAIRPEKIKRTEEVGIIRLDKYLIERKLAPKMIKIDVEGFEFPVLKGLENYLHNAVNLPLILCEIGALGDAAEKLQRYMAGFSYKPFSARKHDKPVDIAKLTESADVLFKPKSL